MKQKKKSERTQKENIPKADNKIIKKDKQMLKKYIFLLQGCEVAS